MPRKSDQVLAARDEPPARIPAMFIVHPERYRDVYRITVSGELDLATYEVLREELRRAEASEAKRILLDLGCVTFIDSVGIRVLIEAHQRSATSGKRLRVFRVSGQVRDVLDLTGVTEVLDFAG